MITREIFKKAIDVMQKDNQRVEELHDLGIDVYNSELADFTGMMFDYFIQSEFKEAGADLIYEYLYETDYDREDDPLEIYEESGELYASIDNVDGLFNYLVQNELCIDSRTSLE